MYWHVALGILACTVCGALLGWRRGNVNMLRLQQYSSDTGHLDDLERLFHRRQRRHFVLFYAATGTTLGAMALALYQVLS